MLHVASPKLPRRATVNRHGRWSWGRKQSRHGHGRPARRHSLVSSRETHGRSSFALVVLRGDRAEVLPFVRLLLLMLACFKLAAGAEQQRKIAPNRRRACGLCLQLFRIGRLCTSLLRRRLRGGWRYGERLLRRRKRVCKEGLWFLCHRPHLPPSITRWPPSILREGNAVRGWWWRVCLMRHQLMRMVHMLHGEIVRRVRSCHLRWRGRALRTHAGCMGGYCSNV